MTTLDWTAAYDRYHNMVRQVCYQYEKIEARLEELCQDVWERAFVKYPQFKEEAEFSTWLYTIARTTALNHIRREKSRPAIDYYAELVETDGKSLIEESEGRLLLAADFVEWDEGEDPESWYDAQVLSMAMINDMDITMWAIMHMNLVLCMPVKEIADITHLQESTVRSYLHAAREEIREIQQKL